MNISPEPGYEYQLGGSLPINAPTYVRRQADSDLYENLKKGKFCYVLNSRQMGKSSLRVQVMQQLQTEGFACAEIDITAIGTADITSEQWYAGVIDTLIESFKLYTIFDLNAWWLENGLLSPVQKLSKFIETVLLVKITGNIVIFIDEIDSILSLQFNLDDFFAVIRDCYNRRATDRNYLRLTFALIGVSTPSDLIQDKRRTPFNIGSAIDLTGFQLLEAQPLAQGLAAVGNPEELIEAVLNWTGGQPFLTQKVCKLVLQFRDEVKEQGNLEALVRKHIIENWEAHDEPEHLKTIRDRILRSGEQRTGRLLGLCQQILQQGEIVADDSPEQAELRLTGLVVRRDGKLRIYNRLYGEVLNLQWCDKQLTKLRPYGETLNRWVESKCQDESRLLRGQALKDAQTWATGKSLSDLDYQFLAASQELEKRETQRLMELETQKQITRIAIASLACITGIAIFAGIKWREADWNQIHALATSSSARYINNRNTFDSLIDALRAAKQLKNSFWYNNDPQLQTQVMEVLSNAVYSVKESDRLEGHEKLVFQVKFSPDGQTLASASFDNTAKLWSLNSKEPVNLAGHTQPVVDVSFSPDGETIATASQDGTAKLWNRQGKFLSNLNQHKGVVWGVGFSPDGQIIATAQSDNTVKVWKSDGSPLKTLNGHGGAVYKVSFSSDGKIATASDDQTVKLWDAKGNLIHTFKGHSDRVLSVNFSADGQTLASASRDKTVIVWDVNQKIKLATLQGHTRTVRNAIFSPNGQTIASASDDGAVKIWRIKDYKLLETLEGHQGPVNSISFNTRGDILASGGEDKTIKIWRLNDWLTTVAEHSEAIYGVDISRDGKMIVSGGVDKTVRLWNLQGQEIKPPLTGHSQDVTSVSFSPDSQIIVSGSVDKTVRRWNLQGQEIKPPLIGHSQDITGVSFSRDGNTIASASSDGTVKLWSREGKLLKNLQGGSTSLYSVSFSPDDKTIASGSGNGKILLWQRNGDLRSWKAHDNSIYNVRFSPNGQIIATSSEDETVKLWNLNGRLLNKLSGHTAAIWGLDFSPNGQAIATGSDDATVKIWNKDAILITTFKAHKLSINSLNFSKDSKKLATASSDKTVLLWNVENFSLDKFINRGCSWLTNYLKHNQNAPNDVCD